ncbi:hypothetical protein DHEL01_v204360 [Diaporthe helianthi]|uniref:Uncharacterized protein n=1 Tax=Diaporthe helianthi TaxID=158607 RepID=A0A2P5I412_DIAHE|nr:hypothetical protein DHEL01_v204360 [Diaporthe helianthi]
MLVRSLPSAYESGGARMQLSLAKVIQTSSQRRFVTSPAWRTSSSGSRVSAVCRAGLHVRGRQYRSPRRGGTDKTMVGSNAADEAGDTSLAAECRAVVLGSLSGSAHRYQQGVATGVNLNIEMNP